MSGTGTAYAALDTLSEDPGRVPAEPGRGPYPPFISDGNHPSVIKFAGGLTSPPYLLDGEEYPSGDVIHCMLGLEEAVTHFTNMNQYSTYLGEEGEEHVRIDAI